MNALANANDYGKMEKTRSHIESNFNLNFSGKAIVEECGEGERKTYSLSVHVWKEGKKIKLFQAVWLNYNGDTDSLLCESVVQQLHTVWRWLNRQQIWKQILCVYTKAFVICKKEQILTWVFHYARRLPITFLTESRSLRNSQRSRKLLSLCYLMSLPIMVYP